LTEHGEGAQTSADASTLRQDEAGVDPHPVRRYQTELFSENTENQNIFRKYRKPNYFQKTYQTTLFSENTPNQTVFKQYTKPNYFHKP
jgi:hypothetical protein